jgi:hypothetical protein
VAKVGNRPTYGKRPPPKQQRSLPPLLLIGVGGILLVIAGVLIAFAGRPSSSGNASPRVTGMAKLEADRESIDFGPQKLNQMVRASFKLSNAGDQQLAFVGKPVVEVAQGC